jgi:hypothetical protein
MSGLRLWRAHNSARRGPDGWLPLRQ